MFSESGMSLAYSNLTPIVIPGQEAKANTFISGSQSVELGAASEIIC